MEGLKIELEGAPYSGGIRYCSQLQSDGWEGDDSVKDAWPKNGETAGQSNVNLEQLEFSLVPKGEVAPPANESQIVSTTAHAKQRWVIERWPSNWPKPNYRF